MKRSISMACLCLAVSGAWAQQGDGTDVPIPTNVFKPDKVRGHARAHRRSKAPAGFKVTPFATRPEERPHPRGRARRHDLCEPPRPGRRADAEGRGRRRQGRRPAGRRRQPRRRARPGDQGRQALSRHRQGGLRRRHPDRWPPGRAEDADRRPARCRPAPEPHHRLRSGRHALHQRRLDLQRLQREQSRERDDAARSRRTARAAPSSPAACATPSASTGIRRPASCGAWTTASTSSATRSSRRSSTRSNWASSTAGRTSAATASINPQSTPVGEHHQGAVEGAQHADGAGLHAPTPRRCSWCSTRGGRFPAEYAGDAFVTMRGSWNRKPAVRLRDRAHPLRRTASRSRSSRSSPAF